MTTCKFRASLTAVLLVSSLGLSSGCGDSGGGEDELGDSDATTGDGDGDPSTGDGDPSTGDGDPSTGDGDGDPGDGDGDGDAASCEGVIPEVTEITPDELAMMLEAKDFELINVHIPNAGEIPGTDIHIAYTDTAALEAYLDNDLAKKAVLYCLTGPMSAIAGAALIELGYCQIYDMPAGMIGWEAEGHPIDP